MSETREEPSVFAGNSYEVIAWANSQEPLLYEEFGSLHGEWLLLSVNAENYFLYKDYYGSCSGCDAYGGAFGWSGPITKTDALKFAKAYPSFIEIPRSTARNLARTGTLKKVFPANIRDNDDINLDNFCKDATLAIKLRENLEISIEDLLKSSNQELKQKALKIFTYERFVSEAKMDEIDTDGEAKLLKCGDIVLVSVKDGSSNRRYLLRVPPEMTSIRAAVAWTFGLSAKEYQPLIET